MAPACITNTVWKVSYFGRCVAASFKNTSAVCHLEMEGTQAGKTVPQRDTLVLLIMLCPAVDHCYSNIQVQRGCCHTVTECPAH